MALREILASFGIEIDGDEKLDKTSRKVDGLTQTLQNLGQALLGEKVFDGFKNMVEGAIELGGTLSDTSDRLGVSTGDLQKFQYAGAMVGVSAEGMSSALGKLNRNLGEAAVAGSQQAKDFAELGIAVKDGDGKIRDAADVTMDLADKLQGMGSQAERAAAITKVLGKSGAQLLPLFKDGSRGVKEAFDKFKEFGLEIDENFIKAADDAGDQIDTLKTQFSVFKTKLVAEALPTIQMVVEWFLKTNKAAMDLAKNTNVLKVVMLAMAGAAGFAGVTALSKFGKTLGIAGEQGLLLAAETLLIVAAIVLLGLVVEDIYTLFSGGDSIIGRFIDELFGIGAAQEGVEQVKQVFVELWPHIKALGPPLLALGKQILAAFMDALPYIKEFLIFYLPIMAGTLKQLVDIISMLIDYFRIMFGAASLTWLFLITQVKGFIGLIAFLLDFLVVSPFDTWTDSLQSTWNTAKKLFGIIMKIASAIPGINIPGIGGSATPGVQNDPGKAFGGGIASILPSSLTGGGGGQASVNQDNKTTININGSGDPQATGQAVSGGLGDLFEQQKRAAIASFGSIF